MFDLLVAREFLDAASRQALLDELRTVGSQPATVYGKAPTGAVDSRMRSAQRLAVAESTRDFILARLNSDNGENVATNNQSIFDQ